MTEPITADYRASFPPRARHLADQVVDMAPTYHEDRDFPLESSPLPRWFKDTMAGEEILGREGPWPQFGRANTSVNWSALIEEHPGEVRYMVNEMTCTPQLCDALRSWAENEGQQSEFDVDFHIEPDGAVGVWVFHFTIVGNLTPGQLCRVHELMEAHGHQPFEGEPQITPATAEASNYAWMLYN